MSNSPIIQLEAGAVTRYRAVFNEIHEPTGRPVTTVGYESWVEVLEGWGSRGFERIEAYDPRIEELKGIVEQCEAAHLRDGSTGVTTVLLERLKEQSTRDLIGFELGKDLSGLNCRVAYDRVLNATPFRDPDNHDWLITGISLEILFQREFEPCDAEPPGAAEMNNRLRVSFTPEERFTFLVQDSELEYSIRRYALLVETSPGMSHAVQVDQRVFESVIERNLDKFPADDALQSTSFAMVLTNEAGEEIPPRDAYRDTIVRGAGKLGAPTQKAELDRSLAWLKKVGGLDDDDINQWNEREWLAWQKAMRTPHWATNPCLPDWMNRDFDFEWHWDFSVPYPVVAQLWPTAENWFLEADRHDDLTLAVDEPMEGAFPDLATLRKAWDRAAELGLIPMVHMTVTPHPELDGHVIGNIDSLVVVGEEPQAPLLTELDGSMPVPGSDKLKFDDSPRELLRRTNQFPQKDNYIGREWSWV